MTTEADMRDLAANKFEGASHAKLGLVAVHLTHPTRPAKVFAGLLYSAVLRLEDAIPEDLDAIWDTQIKRYQRFLANNEAAAAPRRAGRR
jgi:hypothetical protein